MPTGRIYKITCSDPEKSCFYIGSTSQAISTRLNSHKVYARHNWNSKLYRYFMNHVNEMSIELIEEVEYKSRVELNKHEQRHLNLAKSLTPDLLLNENRASGLSIQEVITPLPVSEDNRTGIKQSKRKPRMSQESLDCLPVDEQKKVLNRAYQREYQRQYYARNQQQMKQALNQRYAAKHPTRTRVGGVVCDCGKSFKQASLRNHLVSKVHRNYIRENEPEPVDTMPAV